MKRRTLLHLGAFIAADASGSRAVENAVVGVDAFDGRLEGRDQARFEIPGGIRQTRILTGNGKNTYGPFDFKIFDASDVTAFVRPKGESDFTERPVSVHKISNAALDDFSVTFDRRLTIEDQYVVLGTRVSDRLGAITRGGLVDVDALEMQLSKHAAVEQELRRDLDRAPRVQVGQANFEYPVSDGRSILGWSADGRLVNRPDIDGIAAEAREAAANSAAIRYVADKDELRSLNSDQTRLAFLPGGSAFEWQEIDSRAVADFDPSEHLVVQDPEKPLSRGAWYRRLKGDEPGVRDAFGARGDGIADDTASLQDAINWMEFYPMRSRALTLERGLFNFSQLRIPAEIAGVSFNGRSFWDTTLICKAGGSHPAIENSSQEFKMFHLSLISSRSNRENWRNRKNGLHNDKGSEGSSDTDVTIGRCRIAGFYQGIYHKGRGLSAHTNHFASCHIGIGLDWPENPQSRPGQAGNSQVFGDDMGFRGIAISNTRFHSINFAAVANTGRSADKLIGLKINDVVLDIGRRIFSGDLGQNGSICNASSTLSATEILDLTGGRNFLVSGIVGGGNARNGDRTPRNLIRLRAGRFFGGRFANTVLANCEEHAVRDTSAGLHGVSFSDFTFTDVGFSSPEKSCCFSFESKESTIDVSNVKVMGADTLKGIIGSSAASQVRAANLTRHGSRTPWTSGRNIILIGRRQTYVPDIMNVRNVVASTVGDLAWRYVDDQLIEITGWISTRAAAIGECVVEISNPAEARSSKPRHAWGTVTPVGELSSGIASGGRKGLRLHWVASDLNDASLNITAWLDFSVPESRR
jgi:hypothetical protein